MTFVALRGSDRQRSIKPLFAELAEAFHACGLDMPKINLVTLSTHLQVNFLGSARRSDANDPERSSAPLAARQ